jgi:hypothetical protein
MTLGRQKVFGNSGNHCSLKSEGQAQTGCLQHTVWWLCQTRKGERSTTQLTLGMSSTIGKGHLNVLEESNNGG